ncbi:MAG: hypothetical protein AAFY41_09365, partial [Bacteroidota bacterium]
MKNKHTYLTFSAQSEPILLSEEKQISLVPHKVSGEAELYSDLKAYLDIQEEGLQSAFFNILLNPMHDADEFEEDITPDVEENLIEIEQWLSFTIQEQREQANWDIEIKQSNEKEYLMMGFNEDDQFFWVFPSTQAAGDQKESNKSILFSYDYYSDTLFPKVSFEGSKKLAFGILSWGKGKGISKILKWLEKRVYGKSLGFSEMLPPNQATEKKAIPFKRNFKDWARIDGKRSLLMIPGTFGNDLVAFGGLSRTHEFHKALFDFYEGRIISFNHYTLAESCTENVDAFIQEFKNLNQDITLNVDVLTRSRGGLLIRHLLNKKKLLEEANIKLKVNRVFSIAPPHLGTPLANSQRITSYLRQYSLLLLFLPSGLGAKILSLLLGLAIGIAKSLRHLPGIEAESSEGDFLQCLLLTLTI